MAQGPVQQVNPDDVNAAAVYPQDNNVETLSGDKTVSTTDAYIQVLDPR